MSDVVYDSTNDTQEHIATVRSLLEDVVQNILKRGSVHDASKLQEPEKSAFDKYTPLLRGLTYGSDEYKAALAGLGEALQHHYAANSHHPEHHRAGIYGMSLLDLIEMLADWKAATQRHADGDMRKSLEINNERFAISPQLACVLKNTAREMGWLEVA